MSEVSRAFRRLAEKLECDGKITMEGAVRMVADEIERAECKTVPVETPVDRLKEIREALSQFEDEMDYVEFETITDHHLYQHLMKNLRAVLEAFPVETPMEATDAKTDGTNKTLE